MYPYVSLLTCQQNEQTFDTSLPAGAYMFTSNTCTSGWHLSGTVAGKVLVGLPSGGINGASFGRSEGLDAGAGEQPDIHAQTLTGTYTPNTAGIAGTSGGTMRVGAETFTITGESKSNTNGVVPYAMAALCTIETSGPEDTPQRNRNLRGP